MFKMMKKIYKKPNQNLHYSHNKGKYKKVEQI